MRHARGPQHNESQSREATRSTQKANAMNHSNASDRDAAPDAGAPGQRALDLDYQNHILQGVSRTFALTIPTLPEGLRDVVGNGYLLCRIADTIEDDPSLSLETKQQLADRFVAIVETGGDTQAFAADFAPMLSEVISADEKDLVRNTPTVIRLTERFNPTQRAALARCVKVMLRGMLHYQENESLDGLADQAAMDRYCYFVAGVVGEMLTELFLDYRPDLEPNRARLLKLGISFGQALQMTNILKDIWDDRARGACWLPRETFARHGIALNEIDRLRTAPGYADAISELVAVAHGHCRNALRYTLALPREEVGIRRFCLWALGMAVMNLRKISAHPTFAEAREVKISRRTVKGTVALTSACARYDMALKGMFAIAAAPLPKADPEALLAGLALNLKMTPNGAGI